MLHLAPLAKFRIIATLLALDAGHVLVFVLGRHGNVDFGGRWIYHL